MGISRDITVQKYAATKMEKINKELTKLNAVKDKFFSIISHDLKNQFHSINASLELLTGKEDFLTEEEKEGLLNNIYKISKKAYSLLENLLQWSMHQMDKIDFQPESIELDELIEENIFLFNDSALLKNISLSSNIPPDLFVNADRNMLNTILRNLISNAIKFTPEKGKIDINSNIIEGNVEISVTDNGIGISPDNLEKLLQFNQPFSTNGTHNESGTGFGLLLCKEFIEKNNGALCIESNNNKGSKFAFTLPLKTN